MNSHCVFCREFSGSRDTNFARLYPELDSRIIAETKNLVAFPCIGQLSPGHYLIATKKHQPTFADFIKDESSKLEELVHIIDITHQKLGFSKAQSLYFEHGARDQIDGGCGIYHAHLHIVPNAGKIIISELPSKTSRMSSSMEECYSNIDNEVPYALFGSEQNGYNCATLTSSLPSQTLRKKVSSAMSVEIWDWKKAGREENLLNILSRMRSA